MNGQGRSILPLSLSHLVTDIYMPVIPAVLPLLIADRGLTFFLAGLMVTSYNLTSSATQPIFGWLSDRYGKQVHISTSLLISAVFIGLIGIVGSYPLLLACAALAAIGHACFHPNALSIVSRIATTENRSRITSLFVVGGNIGYAIGPLLAGGVVALFGLEGLLFLVIPAAIMALILRKVLPQKATRIPVTDSGEDQPRVSFSPLASLFAASTLRAWAVFTAIAFFPPLLISRGFDLFSANLMITLMLFAGVAGQIGGGIIADAYGKKEFTIVSLLCSVPFLFIFLGSTGIVSYLALIVFGFFLWSSFAVTVAMSHEILPSRVGMASGLMLGVAIGAGGIGVAINGMIADVYSLKTALYTIPILIVGAAGLMLIVKYPWNILERSRH
ncbi:MAG: MFS transporter [Methanoregulaceae archaeon]|nr:MFS transporter [Methanoregulaceae archaeon]